MVEKSQDFSDFAGLRQDGEILAGLDKQRNGTHLFNYSPHSPHRNLLLTLHLFAIIVLTLLFYRENHIHGESDKVQSFRHEIGAHDPTDKLVPQ